MLLIFAPRSTVQDVFTAIFIPWTLIRIVAKPFCKEWHQLWGVTQHCCDALCSYLSGPHLPHHDDILSMLTRTQAHLYSQWRLYWQCQHATLFYPSIRFYLWVSKRVWTIVKSRRSSGEAVALWCWVVSAHIQRQLSQRHQCGHLLFSSGAFKHWQNALASRYSFSEHQRFYPQDMPRGQTISSWDDWNRVTIMTSCFHVYQCSMHVVTTASHVEQYFLNTQWISSLMRSLWEQIWLGTIWLWEHFWFLSQPLRSGGNRQILGGCWTKSRQNCTTPPVWMEFG